MKPTIRAIEIERELESGRQWSSICLQIIRHYGNAVVISKRNDIPSACQDLKCEFVSVGRAESGRLATIDGAD